MARSPGCGGRGSRMEVHRSDSAEVPMARVCERHGQNGPPALRPARFIAPRARVSAMAAAASAPGVAGERRPGLGHGRLYADEYATAASRREVARKLARSSERRAVDALKPGGGLPRPWPCHRGQRSLPRRASPADTRSYLERFRIVAGGGGVARGRCEPRSAND